MKTQHPLSVKAYRAEGFVGDYQRRIREVVIPYQYQILCDEIEDAQKSHVIQNFINAGKVLRGEGAGDGFYGMVFQDSDAAKWLEAAAYSLACCPDENLEHTADELIRVIADAQEPDGYLDTYYTIQDRKKRWTNLLEGHELYCAGHMIEAACAYFEATGKDTLLQVMEKNVAHIYDHFITEQNEGAPGHPEIELALLKMYHLTGKKHCLALAEYFINTRGQNPDFYREEAKQRSWTVWGNNGDDDDYQQSGLPVRKQKDAVGHAVRAVYLYTGMADLASTTDDASLYAACRRLWESITRRRMYVTGGIGSTVHGEAFSTDYDLPGDTAYCETCAAIGLIFFASRMLENELNGEYADIMERAFYNAVLAGIQLDGKRFFYVNPLEVNPGISGVIQTHSHVLPTRPKWYACACCPPNAARLINSLGSYAYGENEDTVFCHLFAEGDIAAKNGIAFHCKTKYPYDFCITYTMKTDGRLAIRIPGWSRSYALSVNGKAVEISPEQGYVFLTVKNKDAVCLKLDDAPHYIYASARVPALTGRVALSRGPLIYCFEGIDNEKDILSLSLKSGGTLQASPWDGQLLNGTVTITAEAYRRNDTNSLYTEETPDWKPCTATAVPYYTWGNRGENQMRVWMPERS